MRGGSAAKGAVAAHLEAQANAQRAEVLEGLLQADEEEAAQLLAYVHVPPVSEDTCVLRGWPLASFSACSRTGCRRQCMARLANEDAEALDRFAADLKASRSKPKLAMGAAAAAGCKSVWCGGCGAVNSAAGTLLDAVVAEAQEMVAQEPEQEAEDATVVRIISELQVRSMLRLSENG